MNCSECGASFTHNLEGMFKDMHVSEEINTSYREVIEHCTRGMSCCHSLPALSLICSCVCLVSQEKGPLAIHTVICSCADAITLAVIQDHQHQPACRCTRHMRLSTILSLSHTIFLYLYISLYSRFVYLTSVRWQQSRLRSGATTAPSTRAGSSSGSTRRAIALWQLTFLRFTVICALSSLVSLFNIYQYIFSVLTSLQGKKELQVSTLQAIVLMAFNEHRILTCEQIIAMTQISESLAWQTLFLSF